MKEEDDIGERSPVPGAKKHYEKPAFQREKLFETMALSCGKREDTEGSCHFNRKNS